MILEKIPPISSFYTSNTSI